MSRDPKRLKMIRQQRLKPRWYKLDYGVEVDRRECLGMYAARARGLVNARDGFDHFHKKLYKLMGDAWYEEYFGIVPGWSADYSSWLRRHYRKIHVLRNWDEEHFVFLRGNRETRYKVAMYWCDEEYWLVRINGPVMSRSVSYASSDLAKFYFLQRQVIWQEEVVCSTAASDVPKDIS